MIYPNEITPLTLMDYPGKTAAVLWYGGCNLRCPYCYNSELVLNGGGESKQEDAFEIIEKHKHLLDGVVLSGGEATLNPYLPETAQRFKAMGLDVKLDTNGTRPSMVKQLITDKLIDYVALDCKYGKDSPLQFGISDLWHKFSATLKILLESDIQHEVRTTVHSTLMTENHVLQMIHDVVNLGYTGTYYLQPFVDTGYTLANIRKPDIELNWNRIVEECAKDNINVEIRKA